MILNSVGELFDEEPQQWGLRGDPHLWRELRSNLLRVCLPASKPELHRIFEMHFMRQPGAVSHFVRISLSRGLRMEVRPAVKSVASFGASVGFLLFAIGGKNISGET